MWLKDPRSEHVPFFVAMAAGTRLLLVMEIHAWRAALGQEAPRCYHEECRHEGVPTSDLREAERQTEGTDSCAI